MKHLMLSGVLLLAACLPQNTVVDMTGRWLGPEGTYMVIKENGRGTSDISIRNLDGERVFNATPDKNGILTFTRDGETETIRPGTGVDTGMKWLSGKRDCVVVKPGEGYCRD